MFDDTTQDNDAIEVEDSQEDQDQRLEEPQAQPSPEKLQTQLAELRELYENERDLHLRAAAELRNFRRRSTEERARMLQYAAQELITALLPALDHLQMALEAEEQGQDAAVCMTGVRMSYQQLVDALAQFGLQTIEAQEFFDPELHEAVEQEQTTQVCEGTILEQVRKGYKLHDRVIRPAQVKVAVEAKQQ